MGVDVADIGDGDGTIVKAGPHGPGRTIAVIRWAGDVVSVAAHPVPDQLPQDRGAPRLGMFQALQDHHARPVPEHESIPILVEGAAGLGGGVIPA